MADLRSGYESISSPALSDELMARFEATIAQYEMQKNGSARQALWECEDGWVVGYTTGRVKYGPADGKFMTLAYKPTKGSKTGEVVCCYNRVFSTRKSAKARAVELYRQHSPKWAADNKKE